METAKIFQNGRSQAVRLPKDYRFQGKEVQIKRMGNAVVLLPKNATWDLLFEACGEFSDDFMKERQQPPLQNRPLL